MTLEDLPDEVLSSIFRRLPLLEDICQYRGVCKRFRELARRAGCLHLKPRTWGRVSRRAPENGPQLIRSQFDPIELGLDYIVNYAFLSGVAENLPALKELAVDEINAAPAATISESAPKDLYLGSKFEHLVFLEVHQFNVDTESLRTFLVSCPSLATLLVGDFVNNERTTIHETLHVQSQSIARFQIIGAGHGTAFQKVVLKLPVLETLSLTGNLQDVHIQSGPALRILSFCPGTLLHADNTSFKTLTELHLHQYQYPVSRVDWDARLQQLIGPAESLRCLYLPWKGRLVIDELNNRIRISRFGSIVGHSLETLHLTASFFQILRVSPTCLQHKHQWPSLRSLSVELNTDGFQFRRDESYQIFDWLLVNAPSLRLLELRVGKLVESTMMMRVVALQKKRPLLHIKIEEIQQRGVELEEDEEEDAYDEDNDIFQDERWRSDDDIEEEEEEEEEEDWGLEEEEDEEQLEEEEDDEGEDEYEEEDLGEDEELWPGGDQGSQQDQEEDEDDDLVNEELVYALAFPPKAPKSDDERDEESEEDSEERK